MVSKSEITFYGVAEFLAIWDSVQNFAGESAGNTAVPRDGTYAAEHNRFQFSPRGSRFGFRLGSPEFNGIKVTGLVEADFVGNGGQPVVGAEGGFYTSPTLRVRHAWAKLASSAVDITFGQTWALFGWVPSAVGYSVLVPGLPGQLYTRQSQVRLSKVVKGDAVNVEVAVAASRPPQRDSATPDGQAGVRILLNKLQGARTGGPAAGGVEPAAIGISGIARRFVIPEYEAGATDTLSTTGFGVAADVLIPIIPAKSKEERAGALTFNGEAVYGEGISDQYSALTGGIALPTALPPDPATPDVPGAPYNPNIDNGMIALTLDGTDVEAIQWTSFVGGLQFYATNKVWLAVNGSYLKSDNIADLTAESRRGSNYKKAFFVDGVVALDVTPSTRFAIEFARFQQTYVDNEEATNLRVQFGAWYMF